MCGCTKNKQKSIPLTGSLKTLESLIAEGIMAEYIYNGPHATTTRRGEATNTRYAVVKGKCVPLAVADYELFKARNSNEFTPCIKETVKTEAVDETIKTQPQEATPVLPEVTKGETVSTQAESATSTISSIADITALTVANAIPIIREAHAYTLDVWEKQEKAGQGRVMILTAIDKRRQEIIYESQHA